MGDIRDKIVKRTQSMSVTSRVAFECFAFFILEEYIPVKRMTDAVLDRRVHPGTMGHRRVWYLRAQVMARVLFRIHESNDEIH